MHPGIQPSSLTESLHTYFRGEQLVGIGLTVVGVLALVAALWLWRTQNGTFGWWLVVPFTVMGLGAGVGGGMFAVKTRAQVARLAVELEAEPQAMIAAELSRMERVNANWPRVKIAWAIVCVVALALLLFVRREWASALGLCLLLMSTTLLFTDVFAERRAAIYTSALEQARDR